jgi:DNA-binding NarL/FixJ family response regulator
MQVRIGIFEDNERLRNSLQQLFNTVPDFLVTGIYADATNLLAKLNLCQPNLVLMDIDMPGISGIDAVKEIRQASPETIIVMQTIHDDEQKIFDSLKAGAHGYLTKDTKPSQLIEYIREALN